MATSQNRGRQHVTFPPSAAAPQPGTLVPPANGSWGVATEGGVTVAIDPQNTSGVASDSNPVFGGPALPLRSWRGLVTYWGTLSPVLNLGPAVYEVRFISSHTDNTDPVIASPFLANGTTLVISGQTTVVTTTTITVNAAKNRTAGANALLSATFAAGALVRGTLVENVTHSSRAWAYTNVSGSRWNMSQPLVKTGLPPPAAFAPAEVDTWTNGDTVQILGLVNVNVAFLRGHVLDQNIGGNAAVYLWQLNVFDPAGVATDALELEGAASIFECTVDRNLNVNAPFLKLLVNVGLRGVLTSQDACLTDIFAGFSAVLLQTSGLGGDLGPNFDGDVILGGTVKLGNGGVFGLVYLDQVVVQVLSGQLNFETFAYGSHVVYGGSTANFNFLAQSRGNMRSGTWAAGLTYALAVSTGVQLNGSSTGQTHTNASPDVVTSAVATTVANLDAATGGNMLNWGGASLSKAA